MKKVHFNEKIQWQKVWLGSPNHTVKFCGWGTLRKYERLYQQVVGEFNVRCQWNQLYLRNTQGQWTKRNTYSSIN